MSQVIPLGALTRGAVAGLVGSLVQNVFFRATSRWAPAPDPDAFDPPERRQREEPGPGTVARRFVEGMMQRGPLEKEQVQGQGAQIVHYAYGAGWGALYGLARETYPVLGGPLGGAAFGQTVAVASEAAILPAFRLAAPPTRYRPAVHLSSSAAHLVYGLGTWAGYEALRPRHWAWAPAPAALWLGRKVVRRRWVRQAVGRAAWAGAVAAARRPPRGIARTAKKAKKAVAR